MADVRFQLSGSSVPFTLEGYRRLARRRLPRMVWAFVEGGAESESTMRANREAFARWTLRPRVLTGRDGSRLATQIAGTPVALPVFCSPTGMTGMVHWSGEPAAARAAEEAGTRAVISTAASYTLEEIAESTATDHFFQLYPWTGRTTGEPLAPRLLERARRAGFTALFVTVDVPVGGNRLRERRHGMGVPPTLTPGRMLDAARRPRWAYHFWRHQRVAAAMLVDERGTGAAVRSARTQQTLMQPGFDWIDLEQLRELWHGPLYVKGILHPDDAERAVSVGADGIVVSNHGGRQLDGAPASLDALVEVVDRLGGRVPVLLDGGVRTGTDVVKALALGATAVGIGRPYVYGLAAAGQAGVAAVLDILREEITRTLALMGLGGIDELDRSCVTRGATY